MKYKVSFMLLVLTLTACSNVEHIETNTISTEHSNDQLNATESEENLTPSSEDGCNKNIGQTELSDLQKLIDPEYSYLASNEVLASNFIDMDYLVLVRENPGIFGDGCMPWYEYALLGSSYDTYEKGINCYNEVNLFFEEWQIGKHYEMAKERFGDGCLNQYFRRHIVAFSPDAERILLKTYIDPISGEDALYEIYEISYRGSYIYNDIISPDWINYTKGLQFATLDPVRYSEEDFTFYSIYNLSNYYSAQDAKPYEISVTTDSNDTLYYKKDINTQGNKCIGIYSINDNQLIFQSEEIMEYPVSVDILDNRLIVGFTPKSNMSFYSDYFEINMKTNEANYLFTSYSKGKFSPDGKYFASPSRTEEDRGYIIYSLETNELTFIKSYLDKEVANFQSDNNVYCWVRKDKVEELKAFMQY